MSGNCKDGWVIQDQKDLDSVFKVAADCGSPKFHLKDATGDIVFPYAYYVSLIDGTLGEDFDTLNMSEIWLMDRVELMSSMGTSTSTGVSSKKTLVPPAVSMDYTTFLTWIKINGRDNALPLNIDVVGAVSVENLELEDTGTTATNFTGTWLEMFRIHNSDYTGDVNHVERFLNVSDMAPGRHANLSKAEWVRNAFFTNITSDTVAFGTAMIDSDLYIRDNTGLKESPSNPFWSGFTSIGRDLRVHDNSQLEGSFDQLTYAKNISIKNTVDSAFAWPALTDAVSIHMSNNPGTKIPGNMDSLEFVDDIYLNGEIMTDLGPNIFPAIRRAKNSVIIEAWNEDFDCSTLARQWELGYINDLYCNGTNPHTNSTRVVPRVAGQHPPPSVPIKKSTMLHPREKAVIPLGGEELKPNFQGLEGQENEDPWRSCTEAFDMVTSMLTVAFVLGLMGVAIRGFQRWQQRQQRQQRGFMVVDEEEHEDGDEKSMIAQPV
ncbi:hypothetical protein FQN54_000893 [Arachnomyces sp. PD_36]|nr:hypothetical protein FQN54_000893 [Arachnomyces sp. PD_36]